MRGPRNQGATSGPVSVLDPGHFWSGTLWGGPAAQACRTRPSPTTAVTILARMLLILRVEAVLRATIRPRTFIAMSAPGSPRPALRGAGRPESCLLAHRPLLLLLHEALLVRRRELRPINRERDLDELAGEGE